MGDTSNDDSSYCPSSKCPSLASEGSIEPEDDLVEFFKHTMDDPFNDKDFENGWWSSSKEL
jgi:hypothetical protein